MKKLICMAAMLLGIFGIGKTEKKLISLILGLFQKKNFITSHIITFATNPNTNGTMIVMNHWVNL